MGFAYSEQILGLLDAQPDISDIAGYHGTSIAALQHMAQKGYLPTGNVDGPRIFFAPGAYLDDSIDLEDAVRHAEGYAAKNTLSAFIRQNLGIRDKDYGALHKLVLDQHAQMPCDYEMLSQAIAERFNVSPEHVSMLIASEDVQQRKGYLLTISHHLLEDFEVFDCLPGRRDPIDTTHVISKIGLPTFPYISSIKPMTEPDRNLLYKELS